MACPLVGLSRSAYRPPLRGDTVADPDWAPRDWLRAWAKNYPRYGYRRAYHDGRAEGWVVDHKKIQRLWRDEGLRVPQRRRRKRVGSSTVDPPTAHAPNVVWAVDFQFDAHEQGRRIKICSIVDEHTRECIGGLTERSDHRRPAHRPPRRARHRSRIRDEYLNINSFYSLLHAQVVIGDWKHEYNHHRRHSSLGYLPQPSTLGNAPITSKPTTHTPFGPNARGWPAPSA